MILSNWISQKFTEYHQYRQVALFPTRDPSQRITMTGGFSHGSPGSEFRRFPAGLGFGFSALVNGPYTGPTQTEDDAMMQKIMLCLRCNSWMYQYQIYRSWRTHMVLDMCCISPFLLLAKFSTSPSSVVLYECLRHEELLIRSQGGHIPPWQPVCAAQATGGGLGNPCWLGQV